MPGKNVPVVLLAILLSAFAVSGVAMGGDAGLVSTMDLMPSEPSLGGMFIAPAKDVPAKSYTEDYSPPQVFEIIRPNMEAISLGRLTTSCTCIRLTAEKTSFAAGERAILEARNVKATPAGGATYAIFVQMTSPQQGALQYTFFVKSVGKGGVADSSPAVLNMPDPPVVYAPPSSPTPKPPEFNYTDIKPYTPRADAGAEGAGK